MRTFLRRFLIVAVLVSLVIAGSAMITIMAPSELGFVLGLLWGAVLFVMSAPHVEELW